MDNLVMETPDVLKDIVADNVTCVDCGAEDTEWASLSFGTLVCLTCAGFHRSLGTHMTSVRSIQLDSWSAEQVKFLELGGNARFNEYLTSLHLPALDTDTSSMNKYSNPKVLFYTSILKAKVAEVAKPIYDPNEWISAAVYAEQAIKSFTDNWSMKNSSPNSPRGVVPEQLLLNNAKKTQTRPDNWVPDNTVTECMECQTPFTMFFRRHHCRRCGRMVCHNCAPPKNVRPIPEWGYTESVRHCKTCYKSPSLTWK